MIQSRLEVAKGHAGRRGMRSLQGMKELFSVIVGIASMNASKLIKLCI
jgi:hypothetical protein